MAKLSTSYMGIPLKNPLIAGASSLTSNMQSIKKIEEAGAGAIVISSLFEEQIQLEELIMKNELERNNELNAEMTTIFPGLKHGGPKEHLYWVKKAKDEVKIPVIASLNAVNTATWVEYAQKLADTGVDGLELNFYAVPRSFEIPSKDVEKEQLKVFSKIRAKVGLPLSVKLSPYYSAPLRFIKDLDEAGANGFVLFNRLFHPAISTETEKNSLSYDFSNPSDSRLSLRFAGLLSGKVKGSVCVSNGFHTSDQIIQAFLAGADAVQIVSALYKKRVSYIGTLLEEIEAWMAKRKYGSLAAFKGKLSAGKNPDPFTYGRAQYVRVLMKPDAYLKV